MYFARFYHEVPQHSSQLGFKIDPTLPTIIIPACGTDAWYKFDGRRPLLHSINEARERALRLNFILGKQYVAFSLHRGELRDDRSRIPGTFLFSVVPGGDSYFKDKIRAGLVQSMEFSHCAVRR